MRRCLSSAVILFLNILFLSSCVAPVKRVTGVPQLKESFPPNPINKPGWKLTFHDEFNDSVLDLTKWDTKFYWDQGNNEGRYMHHNPKEVYLDNYYDFNDGSIRLRCDTANTRINEIDFSYACGLLDCSKSFEQREGYFEIRSRNPASPGFWPAFWLISRYSWPPEIDIYEYYTSKPERWTNTFIL